MNNIGVAYENKGEHDKAIEYFEKALTILHSLLGDKHPAVATEPQQPRLRILRQVRTRQSRRLFREVVGDLRAVLGDKHPDVAMNLNNIGVAYETKGEHSKAAGAYRAALRTLTVAEKVDPKQTTFHIDELRLLPVTGTVARNYASELEHGLGWFAGRARLEECLSAYLLASDVIDRLREKNFESKESKLLLGEEHSDMFPAWIGAAARYAKVDGTPKGLIQAFEAAERGTSRVFLEELGRRNAKRVGKVDRTTLDAERDIESAVAVADAKIAIEEKKPLKYRDVKKLGGLIDERAKLEGDLRMLIARMEKEFPHLRGLEISKSLHDQTSESMSRRQ